MKMYQAKLSSAKVYPIMGSQCSLTGTRITTLVLEYPRAIHAQLLTHRVFSKNSSSTRAIPLKTAISQIETNPAKFIWTSNQSGMQGNLITDPERLEEIHFVEKTLWQATKQAVLQLGLSEKEGGLNVHKQNAGRYLEPFQNIRICLTSTEWENWDWLRIDEAAQPEIRELAELIKQARDEMDYMGLLVGEYHVPFVTRKQFVSCITYHHPETDAELSVDEAIRLSMSICAQTSYRKEDTSDEKTETVIDRLFTGHKVHASPSEHQATPIGSIDTTGAGSFFEVLQLLPKGVTHIDRNGNFWSGNFNGWNQYRQLIPNHDAAKVMNHE